MKLFVHDDQMYAHDQWHPRFVHVLTAQYGIETRLVNFHEIPIGVVARQVNRSDGLIGRWAHCERDLARIGPIADNLATLFGGRVFPAPHSYLYYDDKARQASLFMNRGYPTPATAVVSSIDELEAFLSRESLSLPIVVKHPHGAASRRVALLRRQSDARFPCIAQQYCPGNKCDYRICVIGHRVMGFVRLNRPDDFRASGSGRLVYVESLEPDLINFAMRISLENHFDSMAYDFVRLGTRWVVLEMSYTYVDRAVRDCRFYYDGRSGERLPKIDIYPQDFIIEDFLSRHYPDLSRRATVGI